MLAREPELEAAEAGGETQLREHPSGVEGDHGGEDLGSHPCDDERDW